MCISGTVVKILGITLMPMEQFISSRFNYAYIIAISRDGWTDVAKSTYNFHGTDYKSIYFTGILTNIPRCRKRNDKLNIPLILV